VGKAMKTARPASGKSKKDGPKKVPQGSSKAPRELAGSR
jgi:hypothetical protein